MAPKVKSLKSFVKMSTAPANIRVEFEGIINNLERRFRDTQSSWIKEEIENYMSAIPVMPAMDSGCLRSVWQSQWAV